jgi:hypothetical protein
MTVLSEQSAKDLLTLADFLEELPADRFNYRVWVGGEWKGKADLSCGTTACALGWATTIPEFADRGLLLVRVIGVRGGVPRYRGVLGLEAASEFFGIPQVDAGFLFMPADWDAILGSPRPGEPNGDAGPAEVAAHIRRYVQERRAESGT